MHFHSTGDTLLDNLPLALALPRRLGRDQTLRSNRSTVLRFMDLQKQIYEHWDAVEDWPGQVFEVEIELSESRAARVEYWLEG